MDTITAWHASRTPLGAIAIGLHVGTLEQAVQRGGGAHVEEITLAPRSIGRVVDRGDDAWPRSRLLAAARRGRDLLVYLNRHEGVDLDEVQRMRDAGLDPDAVGDAVFRRHAPSARDSWIILDPTIVASRRRRDPVEDGKANHSEEGKIP